MIVDDTIVRGDQQLCALIVHSTEDDLGENIASRIKTTVDSDIEIDIKRASTYSELITVLDKATPVSVFILIAHGDKQTHSAWLFADLDVDGNELSLGVAEQATLRDYLKDKVCIFGVCYFGTATLAQAIVGHDGAIFALASKPHNTLTGLDVATVAISLLNTMESTKPSSVTLDLLVRHCVPKIDASLLARFNQFRP